MLQFFELVYIYIRVRVQARRARARNIYRGKLAFNTDVKFVYITLSIFSIPANAVTDGRIVCGKNLSVLMLYIGLIRRMGHITVTLFFQ